MMVVLETKFDVYVFITISGSYLCWWTISLREYHPPSSQSLGTE